MNSSTTVATDASPLEAHDAVASIILVDGIRYFLQHRDDKPGIWYPDYWGCFGGALEDGETPVEALHRELQEELGSEVWNYTFFGSFSFSIPILGPSPLYRHYYEVKVPSTALDRFVLQEGRAMASFTGGEVLGSLKTVPYDAFALFLHISRHRFAAATSGSGA